jgi:hypothetical protein
LRILLGLLLVGILLIVLRVLGARGNYADGNHQKCGESCQYLRHKATRKAFKLHGKYMPNIAGLGPMPYRMWVKLRLSLSAR